jgi:membrane protein YdbS with pleckstrin-like domain
MSDDGSQYIAFVKQLSLFHDIEEDDLMRIAARLREFKLPEGQILFAQGDVGDNFYIIHSGQVSVWIKEDGERRDLAVLESGDYFGEEALLFDRRRSATISASQPTTLLYLDRTGFNWLLENYPAVDRLLRAVARSHEEIRRKRFTWLHENEVIYLIARRHGAQLLVDLIKPFAVIGVAAFLGLLVWWFLADLSLKYIPLAILGAVCLFGLLWAVWGVLDYLNDYYIISNQRVVWLEEVLLQSTSRQDTPLSAIQSVNIETNFIGRALNFGDIIVRTYTGSMHLTDIPDPYAVKELIEELAVRVRKKVVAAREQAMRQAIRKSLGLADDVMDTKPVDLVPETPPEKKPIRLFRFLSTRSIDGETITYHKHWLVLLFKTWPAIIILFVLLTIVAYLMYRNTTLGEPPTLATSVLIGICFSGIPLVWLWYQLVDWKNDIYQLTEDSIIDSERKPFGKEITNSAPIKNILSLRHSRPNIVSIILNYGNVEINVGEETFVFRNVHDPGRVQSDIALRMEMMKFKESEAEAARERTRMAEWMKAYHDVREQADPELGNIES